MADDYSADSSTTGRVPIGGSVTGIFEVIKDVDWFKVTLATGQNYEFDVAKGAGFSSGALVIIDLVNANGLRVAGSTYSTTLNYVPSMAGDYYAVISSSNNPTGSYVVTSSPFDDYTGDFSTSGKIQSGATVTGVLEGASDVDDFSVNLTAGFNYQFTLATPVSYSGASPTETLLNGNGLAIASGRQSITVQPTTSGI